MNSGTLIRPAQPRPPPVEAGPAPERILLAVGNAEARRRLEELLGPLWTVDTLPDGAAAAEAVRRNPPDLILADAGQTDGAGPELLRQGLGPPAGEIPVLVLFDRGRPSGPAAGLAAGADDSLAWPFDPAEAVARVRRLLELGRFRREAARARDDEERMWLALQASAAGAWSWDARADRAAFDERSVALYGFSADDARTFQGWLRRLHPEDRPAILARIEELFRDPAEDGWNEEFRIVRPGGEVVWIQALGRIERDASGEVARLFGINLDITARKRGEAALQASEERLRLGLRLAGLGLAELDFRAGSVDLTAEAGRLLGLGGRPARVAQAELLAVAHPDDRPELERRIAAAFDPAGPGELAMELRVLWPNGRVRWLRVRCQIIFEGAETARRPVRGILAALDVTAENRAAQKARHSEEFVRGVLDSLPQEVAVLDPAGIVQAVNEPWLRFARDNGGIAERVSVGADYLAVCRRAAVEDEPAAREALAGLDALLRGERGEFAVEYPCHAPGRERWFLMNARRLRAGGAGLIVSHMDITELKQAEAALREADRRKDEFLATLAHELRNPLAPIRNGLHVLRRSRDRPDAVERSLDMMERHLRHLVRLIDDLLDISRISRGRIELRRTRVELGAVVQQAVETCRPLIAEAGHELRVNFPAEAIHVDADVTRLAQTFANLLNNAAKYTEPGGLILITAERQGRDALVRVTDSGIGIAPAMLERVFDLFSQVDPSLERTRGGLGIGLHLARRLAELHGGSLEAWSGGPGQGSEFRVRLPALDPAEAAGPAADPDRADPGAARPRRILVADDNEDAAASLALVLELMGHRVRTVPDGQRAVEAAATFRPELILLDIGMPRLNGYEACRRIRAQNPGSAPVIAALTGWGQARDKERSRAAGFDHHLIKPVDPAELERLLERLPD